jgi:uncharacterized protein YgiM (DUF1202 family)
VRPGLRSLGCAALILALASLASARSATLNASARLRRGPAATTDLVAELPAGTKLKILAERGGWRQVETPDGKTGFVWAENLTEDDATAAAPTAAVPTAAAPAEAKPEPQKAETPRPPAATSTLADDVRALRDDVQALRARPEPAAAADLERLRADVDRLAQTQRELVQHIEDRTPASGGDPPPDGALTFAPVLLLIGGALGWLGSRLTAGRRDRRQRNRLRL